MLHCRVLVLEDEEHWLRRHSAALEEHGIQCVCTRDGDDAIRKACEDRSIMVAVIDEILRTSGELQRLTGSDVTRRIHAERPEMRFVMISAKPLVEAGGDPRRLLREERKLRRSGVQFDDVFHKFDLEDAPKEEYARLAQRLKQLHPGTRAKGRVLVGFGVDRATFDRIREACERGRSWWLDVSHWSEIAEDKRLFIVECLFSSKSISVRQRSVFYIEPGARNPVPILGFRPSEIRFLAVLARKAACGQEASIAAGEYSKSSQGALKTAKCRVEARLNADQSRDLRFKPWDGRSYKPEFELGTVLFNIEAPAASAAPTASSSSQVSR